MKSKRTKPVRDDRRKPTAMDDLKMYFLFFASSCKCLGPPHPKLNFEVMIFPDFLITACKMFQNNFPLTF